MEIRAPPKRPRAWASPAQARPARESASASASFLVVARVVLAVRRVVHDAGRLPRPRPARPGQDL